MEGIGSKKINIVPFLSEYLIAHSLDVNIKNYGLTGTMITYANSMNPIVNEGSIAIIGYGNVDGMLRPDLRSKKNFYKFIPNRYKANGMLNPRPYYSSHFIKRMFQHFDSSIRYHLNRFLLKKQGSTTWISLDEFEINYENFINVLLSKKVKPILLSTVKVKEKFFPGTNESFIRYNSVIKKLAEKYNLKFINLFDELVEKNFYCDCYHPCEEGYKKIAKLLAKEIIPYE